MSTPEQTKYRKYYYPPYTVTLEQYPDHDYLKIETLDKDDRNAIISRFQPFLTIKDIGGKWDGKDGWYLAKSNTISEHFFSQLISTDDRALFQNRDSKRIQPQNFSVSDMDYILLNSLYGSYTNGSNYAFRAAKIRESNLAAKLSNVSLEYLTNKGVSFIKGDVFTDGDNSYVYNIDDKKNEEWKIQQKDYLWTDRRYLKLYPTQNKDYYYLTTDYMIIPHIKPFLEMKIVGGKQNTSPDVIAGWLIPASSFPNVNYFLQGWHNAGWEFFTGLQEREADTIYQLILNDDKLILLFLLDPDQGNDERNKTIQSEYLRNAQSYVEYTAMELDYSLLEEIDDSHKEEGYSLLKLVEEYASLYGYIPKITDYFWLDRESDEDRDFYAMYTDKGWESLQKRQIPLQFSISPYSTQYFDALILNIEDIDNYYKNNLIFTFDITHPSIDVTEYNAQPIDLDNYEDKDLHYVAVEVKLNTPLIGTKDTHFKIYFISSKSKPSLDQVTVLLNNRETRYASILNTNDLVHNLSYIPVFEESAE